MEHLLLRVKSSFALTGLGVLLLPEQPEPALLAYELYTQLEVLLLLPDGPPRRATASVEEVTRPTEVGVPEAARALLLTHEGAVPLPAGTVVYGVADNHLSM